MTDVLQRLKQRKQVQWAIAPGAGAWAVLQVLDLAAADSGSPEAMMRVAIAMPCIGLVLYCWVVLLIRWTVTVAER
jgi:hypothetical protein